MQANNVNNEMQQRIKNTMESMARFHALWKEIEDDAKQDAYDFDNNATQ
jgi:hypothetical protein